MYGRMRYTGSDTTPTCDSDEYLSKTTRKSHSVSAPPATLQAAATRRVLWPTAGPCVRGDGLTAAWQLLLLQRLQQPSLRSSIEQSASVAVSASARAEMKAAQREEKGRDACGRSSGR